MEHRLEVEQISGIAKSSVAQSSEANVIDMETGTLKNPLCRDA